MRIDMIGQKFGRLTVIDFAGTDHRGEALWKCRCDCGNETICLGSNLRNLHTQSCGCSRASHGEIKIKQILIQNNVNFETESKLFKFDSGKWARFDFYINKKYLIEFDGSVHFNCSMHGWHTEKQLAIAQQHDSIKTNWCIEHNIPLLRVLDSDLDMLTIEDLILTHQNRFLVSSECFNFEDLTLNDIVSQTDIGLINIDPYDRGKLIEVYDMQGNYIKTTTAKRLSEEFKIAVTNIHKGAASDNSICGGHILKYSGSNKDINAVIHTSIYTWIPIESFDDNGNTIKSYYTREEFFNDGFTKEDLHRIKQVCNNYIHRKTVKHVKWRYIKDN